MVRYGFYGFFLVEEGVDLHLIHSWFYLHRLAEVQQPGCVEVADTNRPEFSILIGFLHGPPGAHIVSYRLVDQIHVQVVQ